MRPDPAAGLEPPLPLEVEDLLMWLTAERGRSANTIEAYRRDLRRLRRLAARLADAGSAT